jgi:hypothetical protein
MDYSLRYRGEPKKLCATHHHLQGKWGVGSAFKPACLPCLPRSLALHSPLEHALNHGWNLVGSIICCCTGATPLGSYSKRVIFSETESMSQVIIYFSCY